MYDFVLGVRWKSFKSFAYLIIAIKLEGVDLFFHLKSVRDDGKIYVVMWKTKLKKN